MLSFEVSIEIRFDGSRVKMSSLDWNNLPAHLMDNLLSNFSHKELKCLSLVSENWLYVIDTHWSDINCLVVDKIESVESSKLTRRRYKHLSISLNVSFSKIKRIYEEFNLKNVVKSLRMEVVDLDEFVSVVKLSGNCLNSLTLICGDIVSQPRVRYVRELMNVKELKIEFTPHRFSALCHNFTTLQRLKLTLAEPGDLEVLQLLVRSSQSTLQDIYFEDSLERCDESYRILESLHLKKAKFKNAIYAKDFPAPILRLKSLEFLELKDFQLTDKDILNIKLNFPNLLELRLKLMANEIVESFTEVGIQNLWEIRSLTNLFISNVSLERSVFTRNPSLTVLSLDNVNLDDDKLEMIVRSSPNLKALGIHMFQVTCVLKLTTLQKVSEHLKSIEKFVSAGVRWTCDENANKPKEIVFQKLRSFGIRYYFEEINEIVKSLRAPRLKKAEFSLCRYLNNEGVNALLENSSSLESLKLELYELEAMFEMKLISKFQKLKSFSCNKCTLAEALEFLEKIRQKPVSIDMSFFGYNENEKEDFLSNIQNFWKNSLIVGEFFPIFFKFYF